MSVFDRLFGLGSNLLSGRDVTAARKAEARGELAEAAELWAAANRPDEAARVMILRGDGETDERARLRHYTQAAATSRETGEVRRVARLKRAELLVAMAGEGAISQVARRDLIEAAAELEALGEHAAAAIAFARAGDTESEARALAGAGDVDKLEDLLTHEQSKDRAARRKQQAQATIELLVSSGRRREALEAAEVRVKEQPDDLAARERAQELRTRRVTGPIARFILDGKSLTLVIGDEIVIGRTEGAIQVSSHAVSRQHVRIVRREGAVTVEDLGSRNGTQLHGMDLAGIMPMGDGLDLKLGREVSLRIAPCTDIEDAIEIEIAGARYVAPLGPLRLNTNTWRIEQGPDGWLELVTGGDPAFALEVALVERTTLLVGDAITTTRTGAATLKVSG